MARTLKKGLDYFPLDIDIFNDLKIRKLIKYQGGKAITVYALLLCNIYKSGYYMKWDKELPFICSELTGFEEAYISEVIKTCLTLGLFSKELFDAEKVLTSKGIQERYSRICVQCRRVCYIGDYNLIEKRKPKQTEKLPRKNDNPQTIQGSTTVQNELQYEPYSMTIDEEIAELKKDECWLDQLQVLHATNISSLRSSLDDFRVQCLADGKDRHSSLQDAKQHFNAWLRIVNDKNKRKDDKVRPESRNQRRGNLLKSNEEKTYGNSF